jgi:hypothetical protein
MDEKIKFPLWAERAGAIGALIIIGAFLGIGLYVGIKENGFPSVSKETKIRAGVFCRNHGYDSVGSIYEVEGMFYRMYCNRITSNYSYEIQEFEVYTEELLTSFEWKAKVANLT